MAAASTDSSVDSEKPHRTIQAFFFSRVIIPNYRVLLQVVFGLPGEMNVCEHAPESPASFPKMIQGCTHSQHEC